MNVETARALLHEAELQRDRDAKALDQAQQALTHAGIKRTEGIELFRTAAVTYTTAAENYAHSVSLYLERERILREALIEVEGGHHP